MISNVIGQRKVGGIEELVAMMFELVQMRIHFPFLQTTNDSLFIYLVVIGAPVCFESM